MIAAIFLAKKNILNFCASGLDESGHIPKLWMVFLGEKTVIFRILQLMKGCAPFISMQKCETENFAIG
jgi:hypothetical protein